MPAKKKTAKASEPFEKQLFKAADKLRKNIDAAEYKHVVLGLIFLKYISDAFEVYREKLKAGETEYGEGEYIDLEDRDFYGGAGVFWVPTEARWETIHASSKLPTIGKVLDTAMDAIERENASLKGVLPKIYAKENLDQATLGGLIDLIADTAIGDEAAKSKDLLGRVYEYFLGEFANAEGKKGGQFYTPKSIVRLMVEMIEPYKGRVYDPACGSGGMFVMSEKFVEEHGGGLDDLSLYGQESNQTTWKLSRMNLAIRGIDGSGIKWNAEGSFLKDEHRDLKADFIIANPPFNQDEWGVELLQGDARWQYGTPPKSNANFGWLQHMVYHLAPNGVAAIVLADMALSSNDSAEKSIRENLIRNDLVECVVSLPDKLFSSTPIGASIWILRRNKGRRIGRILFIDGRKLYSPVTRTRNELTNSEIIAQAYQKWLQGSGAEEAGFSSVKEISEVEKNSFGLFPSSYIEAVKKGFELENFDLPEVEIITSNVSKANTLAVDACEQLELLAKNTRHLKTFKLHEILERSTERLGQDSEPEVLTCTENAGLIFQRERFSKRIATENTSKYKTVRLTDIVYNPYLLWAGAMDQCWLIDKGITSPAYEVFRIKEGFDPTVIGFGLKSDQMKAKYDGISVGTVKRRRRAPWEKFLELEIQLPSKEIQSSMISATSEIREAIAINKKLAALFSSYLSHASNRIMAD